MNPLPHEAVATPDMGTLTVAGHAPRTRIPRTADGFRREYTRTSVRLFGRLAHENANKNVRLRRALEQAHLSYLPDAFTALIWLNTLVAGIAAFILIAFGVTLGLVLGRPVSPIAIAVFIILPFVVAGAVYVAQAIYPEYRASERRKGIDRDLPYAANYVAAMASAGVIPTALFRDLAREKTYGEVSREIAWMVRDVDILGFDLLSAMNRAISRSPSRRFQEFMQGAKTTILSGGDLRVYFPAKAEQYMKENARAQKEFLDSLGILAESYVTVVIAGPLFMLVMLSIMLLVGGSTQTSEAFLFLLVFLLLPIAHVAFSWIITTAAPEG